MTTMRDKIAALASGPLIDGTHINVWTTDERGEPRPEPGRQVEIKYVRADGKKLLKGQTGKPRRAPT